MKRIPKHINTYCTYCKALGQEKGITLRVVALWRISYDQSKRACEAHREELAAYEKKRDRLDGHYSEGDYQSWMRL